MPPHHLPLECWSRQEVLGSLWKHQGIAKKLEAELERRGQRDEWKWAYEVPVYGKTEKGATYLTSGYMLFESATEAYSKVPDIARQYERDPETAPYHVVKVWLPQDHPASGTLAEWRRPEGAEFTSGPVPKADAPNPPPSQSDSQ